ncbi:transferring glycosyl group transferase (DUF604) [Rhynchospora pubera]|uniref:Transferring glycosyl group transferase (DUF604) n=1 Tax=Rhynchospora pubera TaxID=906938 RepID=A0AAV8H5J2_9POAL|nr:transferring glycosyl group transferase (DUF604) [Rhynchospora pubera]KAJ4813110.1 transferring glycosyl group transferase (DUF604) [Rhynchospora pubera]
MKYKNGLLGHKDIGTYPYPLRRRLVLYILLPMLSFYFLYTLNLLLSSANHRQPCTTSTANHLSFTDDSNPNTKFTQTGLQHIVFGIAASTRLWDKRKEYIKVWWQPNRMRGFVWLDKPIGEFNSTVPLGLPMLRVSSDTSRFLYKHRQGHRSAIRLSRIVAETHRLSLPNVRWYVMGDEDTVFVPDNLVRTLAKFDHRQMYYIGSNSESHLQNIYFSYNMAFGGGGFAISRPLAEALASMQDGCLNRYPALYGSDDRIHACMAELGVPLTRHPGFHQYDVYGDLLGLLLAHPVAPLISLHHLNVVRPIFPNSSTQAVALKKLFAGPVRLDSASVMQQSICYDNVNQLTVSLSWGFAVQVVRGIMSPREMEMPIRTFLNWYRRADYTAYTFNSRPVARNPCQKPYVYYMSEARFDAAKRTTVTRYDLNNTDRPACQWKMFDPAEMLDHIIVYKKPDPGLWDRSPRRNCCRILATPGGDQSSMHIDVGVCREGEFSQI